MQVRTGATRDRGRAPTACELRRRRRSIPAELVVWAAGVKAPEFLKDLDGLETNRMNQLVVRPTLQTTRDDDVFAIGDCAAAPWLGKPRARVPPRAQAAHQQASHLVRQIARRLRGQPLQPWRYRDFGSLVSLGEYTTVGNLMGALVGRQPVGRRLVRALDVPVAVQAARAGAARLVEDRDGHRVARAARGARSRASSCIEATAPGGFPDDARRARGEDWFDRQTK